MTLISPVLVVTDEPAGTGGGVPNTQVFSGVEKFSVEWGLSAPEDMSYTANGADVAILTPGVPPAGTRIIGFSLDSAVGIDARMLSGGTQVSADLPPTLSESGKSIGAALTTSHLPRESAQQITIGDAFNGARGTVRTRNSPTRILTPNGVIPYFQGAARAPVGLPGSAQAPDLTFQWIIPNPDVANLPLDIDINRDTLDRITQTVAEHIGSAVDPQNAQFVIDSGDFGVAGGGARTVTFGNLGTVSRCTFQDYASSNTPQPILVGEGGSVQPQTLQMLASTSIIGGDTHHGLPASGNITDAVTLNQTALDATGNFRSGLLVISFYGDRDHGGVYFWPGDGLFHPMSQAMGVNNLWYSENGSSTSPVPLLFAATDAGVYTQVADAAGAHITQWPRLGDMAYKCLKVVSTDATYALIETTGSGATRHVVKYDPGNAVAGYGLDGWVSQWSSGGLFDFGVINDGTGTLLVMLTSDTNVGGQYYYHLHDPSGALPDAVVPIPGAASTPAGIGLDTVVVFTGTSGEAGFVTPGVYLRTDSGAAGLFLITRFRPIFAGFGLTDSDGNQVMVNQVTAHSAGIVAWDGVAPVQVAALAATSAGLFVSAGFTGPWIPTDGQSNLGDINIKKCVSAPPRAWAVDASGARRTLTRFYAIADRSLYISHDGTISWIDALSLPLDEGPYFAAATIAATGLYPDNTTTTVDVANPGGSPLQLIRSLNGLSHPTYALIDPNSLAPAGAHRDAELSYISASAYVPEVPLSEQLVRAEARLLNYTKNAQTIIEVVSWFDDDADALRFLRPTHRVTVNGTLSNLIVGVSTTPITNVQFVNAPFYVLKHRIEYDAAIQACKTYTRLGTLCLDDRTDPAKVTSDIFYAIQKGQTSRSRGHH